jgi:UDP-N-acetylglucosamine acyltransferase
MLAEGNPSRPRCVNIVPLKRHDFSADTIRALAEAHRLIYRAKVGLENARELLRAGDVLVPEVTHLLSFLQHQHDGRNGRGRDRRAAA